MTESNGYGVSSTKHMRKDSFICEYKGEVVSAEVGKARLEHHRNTYVFALIDGRYIDSSQVGNISRFINHSCAPNALAIEWIVKGTRRLGVFARRAIKRGEEVTIDYGDTYQFGTCLCKRCSQ
jgi:SET domain-containing protein